MALHQQQHARELRRVLAQPFEPDFSADNRLDTAFTAFFVKFDGTEQIAQVRNSQSRLAVSHAGLDNLVNAVGAVDDGKFGVKAQVYKHNLHCRKAAGAFKLKILVVDDHALVREGLCQVLQGLLPDEPTEVLQAPDCAVAFGLALTHPDLDLVLLDYHLPDMNGLAALAIFGKKHPELPVVILSGSANPSIMQRVLAQGAAGFITKSGLSDELIFALRRVLNGEVYSPTAFGLMQSGDGLIEARQPPVFTPRQEDVLRLLLEGCSNREISETLGLSDETIKNHITSILRGFGVKTRMQAALEAGRWGYGKVSSAGI